MHFITFSRMMGAKGTEIAELVAKTLEYNLFDTKDIERKAEEMGVLEDIRDIDDKVPHPLKRIFSYRPEIALDRLYMVIYELARSGSAVILGRGGNLLFRSLPCALHVRVIGSQDTRIRNLTQRGYTREEAAASIGRSDHERESFIRFAFHRNWDSAELYDLVFNTDNLSVQTAAGMILFAAEERQRRDIQGSSANSLEMMGLAVRVEAALAAAGYPAKYISTTIDGPGKVRLSGVVQVPWEKTATERVLLDVQGVESVVNEIVVASR